MYYLDEKIKKLNRIFDQNSRQEYLRLDLNENPAGLPEEFVQEVLAEISPALLSQYPETLAFTETLARFLNTDISHICLTNGSSEGIRYIIQAFTSVGGKIVGVTPTYAMFEIYAEMYGRSFVPVPYTGQLDMPVEHILREMTHDVQLLILVNPNNPIGNTYTEEEFRQIRERAEQNEITILIDEAYHYFYEGTFLPYALKYKHIFVTRTFSKLFSMAGLRLGYVAGHPEEIEMVQKLCTPHNVNAFAELFAQRIIEHPKLIEELILQHKQGRDYLMASLDKHGYQYFGDAGNFIFIQAKTDEERLVRRMKDEKNILIKCYKDVGQYGNCLRVTTGGKPYMQQFMDALLELDME